jgi:hypothetical protein
MAMLYAMHAYISETKMRDDEMPTARIRSVRNQSLMLKSF